MKEKITSAFQSFGRVIVDPVLFLAVVGIVLAISTLFNITQVPFFVALGTLLSAATNDAIIGNLPLILCVGIAAGLAKKQKANGAVFAIISYLMFVYINNAYLTLTKGLIESGSAGMALFATGQAVVLGKQVTDINVFGGVIIGCIVAFVYNKALDIKVPEVLRIYGGPRLALIIMIPTMILFSIIVTIIWPPIAIFINNASTFIINSGGFGVFLFGFLNRVLIPTGLHHFLWMPFNFTGIGGTAVVAGQTYYGASNIFYAQMPLLASGQLTTLDPSIRFSAFAFAKEFCALGAVLAMIKCSRIENKKAVSAMLIPIYITASLAGITEALDFIIVFASPWLWVAKGIMTGLSEMVLYLFNVQTYNIYGFIELFSINLALPMGVTKFPLYLLIGVAFVALTYIVFVFVINKFDIKTPGRDIGWGAEAGTTIDSNNKVDASINTSTIVEGLGGKNNIKTIGCCITRLRTIVNDTSLVNDEILKTVENKGIIKKGNEVQIVIGMKVQDVCSDVKSYLKIED